MSSFIQPIETRYKGYRFRSRLEARWAVFFDSLGITWEYEPEGFETPHGRYLPDFRIRLADKTAWFEVKPDNFNEDDPRWGALVAGTQTNLVVARGIKPLCGDFIDGEEIVEFIWGGIDPDDESSTGVYWDNARMFCICTKCGGVGLEFTGQSERIRCCEGNRATDDQTRTNGHDRIQRAYDVALGARFEHGERP